MLPLEGRALTPPVCELSRAIGIKARIGIEIVGQDHAFRDVVPQHHAENRNAAHHGKVINATCGLDGTGQKFDLSQVLCVVVA